MYRPYTREWLTELLDDAGIGADVVYWPDGGAILAFGFRGTFSDLVHFLLTIGCMEERHYASESTRAIDGEDFAKLEVQTREMGVSELVCDFLFPNVEVL